MTARSRRDKDLWHCPECGRGFANQNQSHFCGKYSLETHFAGKNPEVLALFNGLLSLFRSFGPVTVLPEKSRIAFQVRMSFAAVSTRRSYLIGHLVLARRVDDSRFSRIDTISARNHVHHFKLSDAAQLDKGFKSLAKEAYEVGEQRHLEAPRRARSSD